MFLVCVGLVDGEKRAARQRAVSFGVHLTPELFHCSLPPATPVRKGRQPGNTPIRKGRQPGSTPVSKDSSSDSSDQVIHPLSIVFSFEWR